MKCVIVLLALAASTEAYADGAPTSACDDMMVRHDGTRKRNMTCPYYITTSSEVVKAGTPVTMTIAGDRIVGLMVQARVATDTTNHTPVGTFKVDPSDPFLQLMNCSSYGDSVTHKHNGDYEKPYIVTITWIPPKDFNGEVVLRATVVLDYSDFWTGILSDVIKVSP